MQAPARPEVGVVAPDPVRGRVDAARTVELLTRAAEAGLDRVWSSQELHTDALVVAGAVAARHARVGLGTAVVPAWGRHPRALAAAALSVEDLAPGRLVLGVGASHPAFAQALGGRWGAPVDHMARVLDGLRSALHEGALGTGRAPPSLAAAALGPRMVEVVAPRVDRIVTFLVGPRTLATRVAQAEGAAGGRRPAFVVAVQVAVTRSPPAVRAHLDRTMAEYAARPAYGRVLAEEGVSGPAALAAVGSVPSVVDALGRLLGAGADHLLLEPVTPPGTSAEAAIDAMAEVRAQLAP